MPKLGTNTVITNGVLLKGDGLPCILVNGKIYALNDVHRRMHFLNDEIHI